MTLLPKVKLKVVPSMPGSPGATGATGDDGADGSLIFTQADQPATGVPIGSIWIDSDSADLDLYTFDGATWVDTGTNLKGAPGGTPAGANREIQFNNSGSFGADSNLTYNTTTDILSGPGAVWTTSNPNVNADAGDMAGMRINTTFDSGMLAISNPNFSNATALEIVQNSNVGHNVHSGGTNAKKTLAAINVHHISPAAGQKFVEILHGDYYGMGDNFMSSHRVTYAGGPGAGDEGSGFSSVSPLMQPSTLTRFNISALPAVSTLNTTTTQIITGSQTIQTVTVSSSAGANVGDWVVVQQAPQNGNDNLEAVQITAVAAGSITGRFINNHPNGATITPALLITPDSTSALGEQRLLVNMSGASYSTGTITATSGANMTGSGTAWTSVIVGGTASNVGAISLASDDQTTTPFDAGSNRLRAWHPISSVASNTSINIHSFSVAGDQSYKGNGVAAGPTTYVIRPGARILRIEGSLLVCETSAHTWTVGNTVECSICPWADVTAFKWHYGAYLPGGTFRAFMDIENHGFQKFGYGILVLGAHGSGVAASGSDYGFLAANSVEAAIQFIGSSTSLNNGKIYWGSTGHSITSTYNFTTHVGSMVFNVLGNPSTGTLNSNSLWFEDENLTPDQSSRMHWGGSIAMGRLVSEGTYVMTADKPLIDLTQTWQNGAVAFNGIKLNITNNGSAAGSLLLDLQTSGTSRFKVSRDGAATLSSFTVAGLPAGEVGMVVFCSNARMFNGTGTQEGAGTGTGGLVVYNGTAWKLVGTNTTVVA